MRHALAALFAAVFSASNAALAGCSCAVVEIAEFDDTLVSIAAVVAAALIVAALLIARRRKR